MTKFLAASIALACPSASPETFDTGVFVVDVLGAAPAATPGHEPEWIQIAPRGRHTARDGRSFDFNPEVLAARFVRDGVDIAIDLDHATAKKAMLGEAAPAHGWIKAFEARPAGLFGKVEWLDAGKAVLAARTHRYLSPTVPHTEDGRVTWIHSVALVAAPALSMPAIASASPTSEEPSMKQIASLLGLSALADEPSCLTAITTLQARIDPKVHQATLDALSAKTGELETLQASIRKDRVNALLEDALKAKKISPAQREGYEALCANDAGFEGVKKIFETLGAGLGASGLDDKATPGGAVATLSAEDRDVMRQMGLTEEQFRKANGLPTA